MASTKLPARLLDTSAVPALNVTGDLTVDTTTLKVDSTNNRVGIGSAAPANKLDIKGTVGFEATNSTNRWLAYTYTDNTFRLNYNGSGADELTILSNGNVGIGETAPDAPLHITSNTPIIVFDESDASQEYRIGSFGGAFALYDSTDSAYRLAVDGDGKVGIGDTSPFSKLHVEDTSWSSGSPYGTVAYIEGGTVNDNNWGHLVVTNNSTTVGEGGKISLGANGGNPIAGIKAKYQGATYGDLVVSTRPSGGTSTERLTFTHSGHIHTAATGVSFNINKGITQYNDEHNDKSSGLYTRAGYYGSELSNNFSGIYRTPTYFTSSSSGSDIHFMNLFSSSHWGQYPYAEVTLYTTYFYPTYARFDIRMYGNSVKVYPHHNNSQHYNIHDGGGDMPQIKVSGGGNSTTIDYDDSQFSSTSYADNTGAVHSGQPIYRTSISFNTGRDYFYTFAIIKILDSYAANRVITNGSSDAQAITYLSQKGGGFHFKNITEAEAKHGGYNPAWVA